jgi:LysR family transcriptional activator of nhaA
VQTYNFNHLYYFFVTAESGGVSKAAKLLHISQPSLSSQLKILESSLNKKLFEKKGRGVALTYEGERVFDYCKKMFAAADDIKEFLKAPNENAGIKVRIGISGQLERPFIADILSPILKDRTLVKKNSFSVSTGEDRDLLDSLRFQEIDLLLTNRPQYGEELEELAAIHMPVHLMFSSESLRHLSLKINPKMQLTDFMDAVPWGLVLPSEKLKLRQEIDIFFQQLKTRKPIVFESDILSIVGRAILDGAGFGFLPSPYVREEINLNLLSLFGPKEGYWKHSLYLIARKRESYPEAVLEVARQVKKMENL